jgi:hypothetical protein
MTPQPIKPFPRDFDEPLSNLDTDDLNLEDRTILGQIAMLAQPLNLHEKLALTINAHWSIDTSLRQLVEIKPRYDSYGPNLAAAIKLVQHLSAAAKTRLIMDFLCDEWETEGCEGEEKLTGGYNFCSRCNQRTWHALNGDSLKCSACLNTEREGFVESSNYEGEDYYNSGEPLLLDERD